MEITPGRAMYSPDEELKPLRTPKNYRPDQAAGQSHSNLSINAVEFVPRFGNMVGHNNVQERLQRHQRQYIQQNYQQYQQPQQQQPQQQQFMRQQQQPYSNGYDQQQQQAQQQQPTQNIHTQMNSLNINNGQERLRTTNNAGGGGGGRGGGGGGGYHHYQNQQRGQDYQQNSHYRYNKNHHHNQQHNHQQQRYNNHNNHQQQQQQQYHQQQHQQQQQQQTQSSTQAAAAESANEMENIALDYLQTVIQCLNQNPGQFDSIATRFITIFDGMENNHYVLSIAMEDIFNESIKNPNFRYMGAKLYNLLHMLNHSKDSLFHTLLKFKLDFHQQEVQQFMLNKQEAKVRETALFLAELYMQLRGDDSRIYLIAENIVYSLKQLLSMEDNKDNIRCICLTLKLAGYDLTSDCAEDMKLIIAKLDEINCQNPGKYPLATNVITLQKNNWGRKASGSHSLGDPETSKPPEPLRMSDDPIFYGPDGREITAEECDFLTNGANGGTAGSTDNEGDDDDLNLDDEMDEETERDYKLFLKQAAAANNKS